MVKFLSYVIITLFVGLFAHSEDQIIGANKLPTNLEPLSSGIEDNSAFTVNPSSDNCTILDVNGKPPNVSACARAAQPHCALTPPGSCTSKRTTADIINEPEIISGKSKKPEQVAPGTVKNPNTENK